VLIVDDSAASRALVAGLLEDGGCEVVGRAMDGEQGLRLLGETHPDVVVCDVEMPRMDGFTFLRIVERTSRTPVVVLTSFGTPELALFALEYGARDFVVKPAAGVGVGGLAEQLLARIRVLASARRPVRSASPVRPEVSAPERLELVVIGASTGGPPALRQILRACSAPPALPVVIAQHMPVGFTAAFAARLRKTTNLDVAEAVDAGELVPGAVRVAPGGQHCLVERGADGRLRTRVVPAGPDARWVPGVDPLLTSAASACGAAALGVVLTGMGRDGEDGARALREAGAQLWVESSDTAVVDGMPQAAARSHGAALALPLDVLAEVLAEALSRLLVPTRSGHDSPKAPR
jgi:two-component system chemotaxis response regulator CheB